MRIIGSIGRLRKDTDGIATDRSYLRAMDEESTKKLDRE